MRGRLLLQQRVPERALADALYSISRGAITAKKEGLGKSIKNIKNIVRDDMNDASVSKELRLIKASIAGLNAVVRSLIAEGVNVDYRVPDGCTALLFASMLGFLDVGKELIAAKADVNCAADDEVTPLILASN